MIMMTFYYWDSEGLYAGELEADALGSLPECSTPLAPPVLQDGEVARWVGDNWEKLPIAPTRRADWTSLIAARRWLAETSGTTFGGMPIDTADRSKLLINGAALRADRSADYVLRWKTSQGFVDLTAAQVLAVADAVSEHVQLCFDREDVLLGAVADGSITAEMLEEGWPV